MLVQIMGGQVIVLRVGRMVVVVDSQRLRGEATAAALSSLGVPARAGHPGDRPADVALVHDSALTSDGVEQLLDDPSCRVLLVATHEPSDRDPRAARSFGVLPRTGLSIETVVRAVAEARAGRAPRRWTAGAPASESRRAEGLVATLSPRERAILQHVAAARRNEEIGSELGISANTVRTHVQNILGKLEVGSRVAAVAVARRGGLDLELRSERGAS